MLSNSSTMCDFKYYSIFLLREGNLMMRDLVTFFKFGHYANLGGEEIYSRESQLLIFFKIYKECLKDIDIFRIQITNRS